MTRAVLLFVLTYALMLLFEKYRPWIALASGALFVAGGMLPVSQIPGTVDVNVLLMIGGTMGLVQLFIDSRMPDRMAEWLMDRMPNVQWAAVCLSMFAGLISAFVDNVATVLMVAPVAVAVCRKLGINPVPFVISIAVSSNLQGAATLVGDTTAIMLGSALDMSFADFFWYRGRPSGDRLRSYGAATGNRFPSDLRLLCPGKLESARGDQRHHLLHNAAAGSGIESAEKEEAGRCFAASESH